MKGDSFEPENSTEYKILHSFY